MTILNISNIYGVNFESNIIPKGNKNRSGKYIKISKITIHTTQNTSAGANADSHARFCNNGGGSSCVSWHFTVDDKKIIQHLPLNEQGYHAGTSAGNNSSIGIEICENSDGNFEQATNNAAKLVKYLMNYFGFNINCVVSHQYWSGKYCPRPILDKGFSWFTNKVNNASTELEKPIQSQGIGLATSKFQDGYAINTYKNPENPEFTGRVTIKGPYLINEGYWGGGSKDMIRIGTYEQWVYLEHYDCQWFYAYSKYPVGHGVNIYDDNSNYVGNIDGSTPYSIWNRIPEWLLISTPIGIYWAKSEHFNVK